MTCWNSSPLRGTSATEKIKDNQRNRVNALYHPLSSPIARSKRVENQEQIRDTNRQERLRLQREEVHSRESDEEYARRLEEQARTFDVDIDVLLAEEEEQHQQEQNSGKEPETETNDVYEEELEDYLTEADLELEAQLKSMKIT